MNHRVTIKVPEKGEPSFIEKVLSWCRDELMGDVTIFLPRLDFNEDGQVIVLHGEYDITDMSLRNVCYDVMHYLTLSFEHEHEAVLFALSFGSHPHIMNATLRYPTEWTVISAIPIGEL